MCRDTLRVSAAFVPVNRPIIYVHMTRYRVIFTFPQLNLMHEILSKTTYRSSAGI